MMLTPYILVLMLLVVVGPGNAEEPEDTCVCECPDCPACTDCDDVECPTLRQSADPEDLPVCRPPDSATDCQELRDNGHVDDGLYYVLLGNGKVQHSVYCDMQGGNGWLVIQRRVDGSVNFTHTFNEYKHGFGYLTGEFWLGNDALYRLTNQKDYTLRVEMTTLSGTDEWAEYSTFRVAAVSDKFRLTVGGYSGNTSNDRMAYHNNQQFSTEDQDNDEYTTGNCGKINKAGWWFNLCHRANLNGVYTTTQQGAKYLSWRDASNAYTNLQSVTMKVRPTPST